MYGLDDLISAKELSMVKSERSKPYITCSILPAMQQEYELTGWVVQRNLKRSMRMQKAKSQDEQFEDDVWLMLNNLGFPYMNRDNQFTIKIDPCNTSTEKQIDIIATDDETTIIVKCVTLQDCKNKEEIKSVVKQYMRDKPVIVQTMKKAQSGKKIKLILATKGIIIQRSELAMLDSYSIMHMDDNMVKYYTNLAEHLGTSARYQFLGYLFSGQRISSMDCEIPAIEGKMGGLKYYAFSIEPERLLKIGYVLHRNEANNSLMPTYQRLIKKTRLKSVRSFIEQGGYFPNSLVISIDTEGKGLQFDLSSLQSDSALSRIGILHLPQTYRSAYIIDGQHRLYGYADLEYARKNCIPVVAFVDLEQETQIKLFMDINENQKSVSKALRLTLESDLLLNSKSYNKRRKAVRLQVAQNLGLDSSSPLYNRIIIGENQKTSICYITLDTIQTALSASHFLNRYNVKNEIIRAGTFDRDSTEETICFLVDYLIDSLSYIQEKYPLEWSQDEKQNIILSNNGIWATIKILDDIINHLIDHNEINIETDELDTIVDASKIYVDALIEYRVNLTPEQIVELRSKYGSGGKTKCWRDFEKAIFDVISDFCPEGLEEYINSLKRKYNEDSYRMIRDIELMLKNDFRQKLISKYGDDWFFKGLPKQVYNDAMYLFNEKQYESKQGGNTSGAKQLEPWDCLTIINYRQIAIYGSNWSELFEKEYIRPEERKKGGNKNYKTEWMQKLNTIRNQNFHTYSVTSNEYEFILSLHKWLIG